ncbi:hypothetical protein C4J65_29610 [Streptomyces sp. CB09001]|uniref:hypothetical protein n=1 Tax=unclassified Streptomyces TaxID=2593676 RepID=UPI000E212C78|nr:hypothetical protein [Streptomyces sp. CB09001]AXL91987.1 hypothetical protein C4J65_29610 [Streptomyces sp. CB09001]
MRRTARALSVAVLASAALGLSAGVVAADPGVPPPPSGAGEPVVPPPADDAAAVPPPSEEEALPPSAGQAAARVSPADAGPGDTVTVSVSCGPTGGSAPASLDATSAAFAEGTVELRKVADDAGTTSGPAYRGTARMAAAEDFAAEPPAAGAAPPEAATDPGGTTDSEPSAGTEGWSETDDTAETADDWTVDGACPDASGGEGGDPWSATMSVPEESGAGAAQPACRESAAPRAGTSAHGTPCAPTKPPCPEPTAPRGGAATQGTSCGGATAEHGVRAGAGGSLGDSVPALAAGGLLIAGACGAAAHRLRLRLRGEGGER